MSALRCEMITEDTAIPALARPWEALWRRVPGATPFQSPAWLLPWWQVFGTGRPIIGALWRDARLAGILPLYLLDEAGRRKLLPMGVGLSDYVDLLIEPDLPAEAAGRLLRATLDAGFACGATVCDLVDLPAGAALLRIASTLGPPGEGERCPVLPIGAARSAEAAIPARQARKLRMNRHRAARRGGWAIEWATASTTGPMLDQLLRLNALRWGEQSREVRRFHRAAAPRLLAAGLLRLARLRIGGQDAACCHALADRGRLMLYMSGFDPAFAESSPGTLLVAAMIDAAIAEGCREVHFLRGGEAYKYAWGAVDRRNASLHLTPARAAAA